jgi:hypothetical protein
MSVWFKRSLVILTIGGGFLGFVGTSHAFLAGTKTSWYDYTVPVLFMILYAFGIFSGIGLTENRPAYSRLLFYFAIQVPFVSSPFFVYEFTSGCQIAVGIVGSGLIWSARLGSNWEVAIRQPNSWGVGINVFALIVMLVLYLERGWNTRELRP